MKRITSGSKHCKTCGRLNKVIQLFTSYAYTDCEYCTFVNKDKVYTIQCVSFNGDSPNKAAIAILKPNEDTPEFIKITHSYKEATRVIQEVYEKYGGKGNIINSDDWEERYYDENGFETEDINMDENGQVTSSIQFEGN